MAGSRLVQSPFIKVTFLSRKISCTAESENALRSLTRQVRHQLAVKLTSSGRPAAVSSATRAALYGCHSSAPALDCADSPGAAVAVATSAKRIGKIIASSSDAAAVTSTATLPPPELELDF